MSTYSKENEALVQFPVVQLDSRPWWGSVGSLSVPSHNADSVGQLKSTEARQGKWGVGIGGYGKGNETQVTASWDGQKTQPYPAASLHLAPADNHTWLGVGYSASMIFPNYPYGDQSYSLLSTHHGPQNGGRIMLPLSLKTDEGPIFVNPKQYHGIMRRRQSRAKAELLNKPLRGVRKQYIHESRHLHAKRRARGAGGRFLNTTKAQNESSKQEIAHDTRKKHNNLAQSTGSQNSEVLQSDINGGNPSASGSEAASSIYNNNFHGDFGFLFNTGIPQASPMATTPAVKWTDYFDLKI